ncbi:helix-turn-helix transcriptional regulator [Nioella sp.]|uniref:S24 family peptidase n=1 Tax=Nioella sp. TaxID=1912091 RepID=UPI003517EC9E
MKTTFRDAFIRELEKSGRSLRDVALKAGVSYEQAKKFRQGKSSTTNAEDAVALAAALGFTVEDLLGGRIPAETPSIAVAGRVGAGDSVFLADDYAKGDGLYHIVCPPQLSPSGIVGVEVQGQSMAPIYHSGDVLLYSRDAMGVPTEALDRICICEDDEHRVWVKQVKLGTGPGLFHLITANPMGQNQFDVALIWAAPVRMHLPVEFVRKV